MLCSHDVLETPQRPNAFPLFADARDYTYGVFRNFGVAQKPGMRVSLEPLYPVPPSRMTRHWSRSIEEPIGPVPVISLDKGQRTVFVLVLAAIVTAVAAPYPLTKMILGGALALGLGDAPVQFRRALRRSLRPAPSHVRLWRRSRRSAFQG